MRNILERRSAAFAGTVCALLLGISGVANADDSIVPPRNLIYYNAGPVNVRAVSGEVLALQQCLADAQDGVINYAQDQCDQIAIYGNYLELQDVNLAVYDYNTWGPQNIYRRNAVDMWVSGGSTVPIIQCLVSVLNGATSTANNPCPQEAVSGNLVMVSGVGIYVYQ